MGLWGSSTKSAQTTNKKSKQENNINSQQPSSASDPNIGLSGCVRVWDPAFTSSTASSFLLPFPPIYCWHLPPSLLLLLLFFNLVSLSLDWVQLWLRMYWNGLMTITYYQILLRLLSWKSATITTTCAVCRSVMIWSNRFDSDTFSRDLVQRKILQCSGLKCNSSTDCGL